MLGRVFARLVVLWLAAVRASAAAQTLEPVPTVTREADGRVIVRAVRADALLRIDGQLTEDIYEATTAIGDFIQQEPDEGKAATEKTEAWIFFDGGYVYVAARCWESHPERRVANEMRRDTSQLRQNGTFAVLFDTFHDRRNGYLFYANPIGGLADSQITDEGPPNVDWNTVWDVQTGRFEARAASCSLSTPTTTTPIRGRDCRAESRAGGQGQSPVPPVRSQVATGNRRVAT